MIANARGRGNPFPQFAIRGVSDGNGVGRPRLPLLSGNLAAFNPVIDDIHADRVLLANLINGECSERARGTRDPMLKADPAYHAGSEGLARRAPDTVTVEQGSDVGVVALTCQASHLVNDGGRISHDVGAVRW